MIAIAICVLLMWLILILVLADISQRLRDITGSIDGLRKTVQSVEAELLRVEHLRIGASRPLNPL